MQILVFKTNLTHVNHVQAVESGLNVHPAIRKWNVDLKDCDNILRVVADDIAPQEVQNVLLQAGYYCEELE